MFSHLPPRQRVYVRSALSLAWAMAALGGFSSLLLSPIWPLDALAVTGRVAGVILSIMALMAAMGVATNRYRVEWVAAWFSATALAPYTLVFWYSVFSTDLARMSSAFLLTALLCFFVTRAIMCSAHAARLRLLHEGDIGDG
jgi:Na+/H+ antiporter NhaD/arsenite permease-like protein